MSFLIHHQVKWALDLMILYYFQAKMEHLDVKVELGSDESSSEEEEIIDEEVNENDELNVNESFETSYKNESIEDSSEKTNTCVHCGFQVKHI